MKIPTVIELFWLESYDASSIWNGILLGMNWSCWEDFMRKRSLKIDVDLNNCRRCVIDLKVDLNVCSIIPSCYGICWLIIRISDFIRKYLQLICHFWYESCRLWAIIVYLVWKAYARSLLAVFRCAFALITIKWANIIRSTWETSSNMHTKFNLLVLNEHT